MIRSTAIAVVFLVVLMAQACSNEEFHHPDPMGSLRSTAEDGAVHIVERSLSYIEVSEVGAAQEQALLRAPGRVAFRSHAVSHASSPVEGRIAAVHVQLGDVVSEGDRLFTIQSTGAAEVRSELRRAEVALEAAEAEFARQERMRERGVGVDSEHFAARIARNEAVADLERARITASLLGPGGGQNVVVRASIAGTILSMNATLGIIAEAGEPLLEIGDADSLWVTAWVFERDISLVSPGAQAHIELPSQREPLQGTVSLVGAVVDPELRRVPVYIEFDAIPERIRPGMYARVGLETTAREGSTLPASAVLVHSGDRHYVYVEEERGRFRRRDVIVGASINGQVQVLAGIEPGDRVVVSGALLIDSTADLLL